MELVDRAVERVDSFQQDRPRLSVAVAVVKKFGDDEAGNLAALVSYYSFFALLPLLLVFVTMAGFVLADNPDARQALLDSALESFPVVGSQLRDDLGSFRGSGMALAVGVVGALWGGLGAIGAMQNMMNGIWDVPRKARPNFLETRLRSAVFLVVIGASLVVSTMLGSWAPMLDWLGPAGKVLVLVATAAVNVGVLLLSFKTLTDADVGWRTMLPGAVASGIGFSVLQLVGGWYIGRTVTNASQLYGTFAIVLGLLTWLYVQAQLVGLGAELNVVLHRRAWPRSLRSGAGTLTPADEIVLTTKAEVEERIPGEQVDVRIGDGVGAVVAGDGAPERAA